MKNKILILILLFAIGIPQIVSAAWWNPFSWKIFTKIFSPKVETTKTIVPDSNDEIEKLRLEVEELKKQNAANISTENERSKKTTTGTRPTQPTAPIVAQPQVNSVNSSYMTQTEIGTFVSALKDSINKTSKIKLSYDNAVANEIRPEMADYPDNQLLQQAGQDVIAEFSVNLALMDKVDAESQRIIDTLAPYLSSGKSITFNEVISLGQNLKSYNQEYDKSYAKLKKLLLAYYDVYSSILGSESIRLKGLIDEIQ